jgi:hypothetical protein
MPVQGAYQPSSRDMSPVSASDRSESYVDDEDRMMEDAVNQLEAVCQDNLAVSNLCCF